MSGHALLSAYSRLIAPSLGGPIVRLPYPLITDQVLAGDVPPSLAAKPATTGLAMRVRLSRLLLQC